VAITLGQQRLKMQYIDKDMARIKLHTLTAGDEQIVVGDSIV